MRLYSEEFIVPIAGSIIQITMLSIILKIFYGDRVIQNVMKQSVQIVKDYLVVPSRNDIKYLSLDTNKPEYPLRASVFIFLFTNY